MLKLYVLQGPDKGATFRTNDDTAVIGRLSDKVPLSDHSISRRHAELRREKGSWVIQDHHSSNGTYVNGQRIHQPVTLRHGDHIRLGGTLLVFSRDESKDKPMHPLRTQDVVELDSGDQGLDSSILATATASEESVILASPDTHDAVHAWNVLYQLAETIGKVASAPEFLERMTDIIFQHLQVDRLFVLMREPGGGEMKPSIVRYRLQRPGHHGRIITSRRIINHVVAQKEGVLCANAQTDVRFGGDQKDASIHRLGLRSVICVPILIHDEVSGIIHFDCPMAIHTYTQQQLLLATAIGKMAGMSIENARLIESRVRHERLAAVGETVAHLSHNIRNILQGMRSGADVIEMALQRGNMVTIRAGWQIVQRNLERTYRLASNMLTFSKEREPHVVMGQVNSLVDEVVELTRKQADAKGVAIETRLDELPPAPIDADGVHQVLTNIIINAIEACPKSAGRIEVATHYDGVKSQVVITVTDNGHGIPEDERDMIFNPFHSTKGHGGTGLGLAASKKIIDELHGTIDVGSSPAGTTFTITLGTTHVKLSDSDETHGPAV